MPIAVGSKDKWPDAFWWEYFALRECPTATLQASMKAINLSNSCFTKASKDLTAFMNTNPFQAGFLGTPSQVGRGQLGGHGRQRQGGHGTAGRLGPRRHGRR